MLATSIVIVVLICGYMLYAHNRADQAYKSLAEKGITCLGDEFDAEYPRIKQQYGGLVAFYVGQKMTGSETYMPPTSL